LFCHRTIMKANGFGSTKKKLTIDLQGRASMQGTIIEEISRQSGAQDQTAAVNQAIAERIGPQKYRIWFKNSTKLTLTDGYLKIGVPNLFIASWIENHFSNEISQAAQAVTGSNPKITFAIDPELLGNMRRTQLDSQAQLVTRAKDQTHSRRARIPTPPKRKLKFSE
jgi:chromosomal replication initiation ATPase DnaA